MQRWIVHCGGLIAMKNRVQQQAHRLSFLCVVEHSGNRRTVNSRPPPAAADGDNGSHFDFGKAYAVPHLPLPISELEVRHNTPVPVS